MELFLFLSRLLQRFRFRRDPGDAGHPDLTGYMGITIAPLPYNIVVEDR